MGINTLNANVSLLMLSVDMNQILASHRVVMSQEAGEGKVRPETNLETKGRVKQYQVPLIKTQQQ